MRYISSKMSDIKDYNFPAFRTKQRELEAIGIDVYNPIDHEPDKTDTMWSEYLAQDIVDIEKNCDSILMFGKWYRSQGACVELLSAQRLGLDIYIEQWWLRWIPAVLDVLFKTKWLKGTTKEEGRK